MSSIFEQLYLGERNSISFVKADGTFIPYTDSCAPEFLSESPIIISKNSSSITGKQSGNRSGIVELGGTCYKLKGCNPKEGKVYDKEPWGGMSRKKCANELKSNKKISKRYAAHDLTPPLLPLGYIELKQQFDGDNICCAVMECSGDLRLSEVHGLFLRIPQRHRNLGNYDYLNTIFSGLAEWQGFNQRILKEAGVAPNKTSFDSDNYVLHRVSDDGFGIARVDLSSALHNGESEALLEEKREYDISDITALPRSFYIAEIARAFGIPFKSVWRGHHKHKDVFTSDDARSSEWKEEDESSITLHVNPERFSWVETIRNKYLDAVAGTDVPEPIKKKILDPLFH